MLTPYMEVTKTLMKKDSNLSTHDGLVDLAVELDVQFQSLEVAYNNWDAILKIIMEVHKFFLDKHTISVPPMT